jgi:hypothetical protein
VLSDLTRFPTDKRFFGSVILRFKALFFLLSLPLFLFHVPHNGALIASWAAVLHGTMLFWLRDHQLDPATDKRPVWLLYMASYVLNAITFLFWILLFSLDKDGMKSPILIVVGYGLLAGLSLSAAVTLKSARREQRRLREAKASGLAT